MDKSVIKVYYTVFRQDKMLHVTVDADFHGKDVMVKFDIPTATNATRITRESAYILERPRTTPITRRDRARWDNHHHTWCNLQARDGTWGMAVINEGKYGIDTGPLWFDQKEFTWGDVKDGRVQNTKTKDRLH